MAADSRPHLTDHEDTQLAEYHALSKLAVAGLIFGLLAPVALVDPLLWALPLLGVVFSGFGLWRIAGGRAVLVGRKAALAGLMLSLFFGAVAAGDWLAYRLMVRAEARRFVGAWFEMLAGNQPMKAHQLTLYPRYRRVAAERLEDFYAEGPRWQEELDEFLQRPLIAKLLDFGPEAQVRYLETTGHSRDGRKDYLFQVYAVTYQEDGRPKTIVVGMQLERHKQETGVATWRIASVEEGDLR